MQHRLSFIIASSSLSQSHICTLPDVIGRCECVKATQRWAQHVRDKTASWLERGAFCFSPTVIFSFVPFIPLCGPRGAFSSAKTRGSCHEIWKSDVKRGGCGFYQSSAFVSSEVLSCSIQKLKFFSVRWTSGMKNYGRETKRISILRVQCLTGKMIFMTTISMH